MLWACLIVFLAPCAYGRTRHVLQDVDTPDVRVILTFNPQPAETFTTRPVSLHIVIPCIGRRSVYRLLSSLAPQLEQQDYVTVIFDGIDKHSIYEQVKEELARMPGNNMAFKEAIPAGDSGNTPRNKHRHEAGDFVMFADDDNHYTADALSTIRRTVQHDREALYIFQMRQTETSLIPSPGTSKVAMDNIDSGCGVVPSRYAHLGDWTTSALPYAADFHYYQAISQHMPRTYFIEKVIYIYSGWNQGRDVTLLRRLIEAVPFSDVGA